jgi:uracil-DNA glycosylase family 4
MGNDDLRAHLQFFADLGVDGVRREAAWRTRAAPAVVSAVVPAVAPDVDTAAEYSAALGSAAGLESAPEAEDAGSPSQPLTPGARSDAGGAAATLAALRVEIGPQCTRCKLHTLGRQQVVFGVGSPSAALMFVGEAPGADEDVKGEPFVGRAGQLLTKIIESIGLTRDAVYIANVIKCRPPGNRNPEPDEVEHCEPFLFRQIDAVAPKVIVALGKFAAQCLLKTNDPITRIRGREFRYRNAVLIPTYHPAYLLRNPPAKREVWEDMKRVQALLSQGSDG